MTDNRYTNNPLRHLGGLSTNDPQDPQPVNNEDFWKNPVAPFSGVNRWPQQWSFEQQEQEVVFVPDEDFWTAPPKERNTRSPRPWTFDAQEGAFLPSPDEDYWQRLTAPIAGSLRWPQPFIFDLQESPVPGKPDEDFCPPLWQNPFVQVLPSFWNFDIQDQWIPYVPPPPTLPKIRVRGYTYSRR